MIALTFDTDYLSKDDLQRFVEEFPLPGRATFFLWRPEPGIDLGGHEIGIHPFFEDRAPWRETLARFLERQGGAPTSIRPHSCAYSHMLGIELVKLGFTTVSQATYLYKTGLEPYRHPWGLWELPIYYMESMDFTFSHNWPAFEHEPFASSVIEQSLTSDGLFVYDFHPLHVICNTSSYPQYQSIREDIVRGRKSPFDVRLPGRGARTFYLELLERMGQAGVESTSCSEAPSLRQIESALGC